MARILFKNLAERSSLANKTGWWLEAAMLRSTWWLLRRLSPRTAAAMGAGLLRRIGPLSHKHDKIIENLRHVLPSASSSELDSVAREVWSNFGAVMAEMPNMARFATDPDAVRVEIDPKLEAVFADCAPCVFVFPHLANWELPAYVLCARGFEVSVIYSPQANPGIDRLIQSERVPEGSRCIPKQNGIRQLVRELRSGRSVALLPDQRVDEGEPIEFFGEPALTTTSPAWLATKMGVPLVPVRVIRLGAASFEVCFDAPLKNGHESAQNGPAAATLDLNHRFEDWIRAHPGQWLCAKRRWAKEKRT